MKTIVINQEGFLVINDQVLKDEPIGKSCLESIVSDNHVLFCSYEEEKALLAPQSYPLVVQDYHINESGELNLAFNYGYESQINIDDLLIDDWSRLAGLTLDKKIPFVFSGKVQEKFFSQSVQTVCEDEIVFKGKNIELDNWYLSTKQNEEFWGERYISKNTPWDLQSFHPVITKVLPRLKLHKARLLVPGCGRGHDAKELSKLGHHVTGLDFSAAAIHEAKELYGESDVQFVQEDIFEFAKNHDEDFDGIFEHTLFCAIEPSQRLKLVKAWNKMLVESGHLIAVFFVPIKRNGPPFGVSEWEIQELLKPYFNICYWGRLTTQESARPMRELFVYAQKKFQS